MVVRISLEAAAATPTNLYPTSNATNNAFRRLGVGSWTATPFEFIWKKKKENMPENNAIVQERILMKASSSRVDGHNHQTQLIVMLGQNFRF